MRDACKLLIRAAASRVRSTPAAHQQSACGVAARAERDALARTALGRLHRWAIHGARPGPIRAAGALTGGIRATQGGELTCTARRRRIRRAVTLAEALEGAAAAGARRIGHSAEAADERSRGVTAGRRRRALAGVGCGRLRHRTRLGAAPGARHCAGGRAGTAEVAIRAGHPVASTSRGVGRRRRRAIGARVAVPSTVRADAAAVGVGARRAEAHAHRSGGRLVCRTAECVAEASRSGVASSAGRRRAARRARASALAASAALPRAATSGGTA